MKVKELIAELQKQDPEAHVTYWFDVHEGNAPVLAGGCRPEFVKMDEFGFISAYSDEDKPGFVAAVRID